MIEDKVTESVRKYREIRRQDEIFLRSLIGLSSDEQENKLIQNRYSLLGTYTDLEGYKKFAKYKISSSGTFYSVYKPEEKLTYFYAKPISGKPKVIEGNEVVDNSKPKDDQDQKPKQTEFKLSSLFSTK